MVCQYYFAAVLTCSSFKWGTQSLSGVLSTSVFNFQLLRKPITISLTAKKDLIPLSSSSLKDLSIMEILSSWALSRCIGDDGTSTIVHLHQQMVLDHLHLFHN